MPIHDWSRVRAGRFHHFHNAWIYKLSDHLNGGLLPAGFYAAGEQVMGDVEPDVLTFHGRSDAEEWQQDANVVAVQEHPPQVQLVQQADESVYVRKQDHVVIRESEQDRVVAWIEIVSRGNKTSRREIDRFLRKTAAALDEGINLLIVDLQSPGSFDEHGIHAAIWDYLFGTVVQESIEQPLTLAAYRAAPPIKAYVEPTSVERTLTDMPLFLSPEAYVNVPLEETYMDTWAGFPQPWKDELRIA